MKNVLMPSIDELVGVQPMACTNGRIFKMVDLFPDLSKIFYDHLGDTTKFNQVRKDLFPEEFI